MTAIVSLRRSATILVLVTMVLLAPGCPLVPPTAPTDDRVGFVLLGVDGLAPPAIAVTAPRSPGDLVDLRETAPAAGFAAAFSLRVATDKSDAIHMRLTDSRGGAALPPPHPALGDLVRAASEDEIQAALRLGRGVFRQADRDGSDHVLGVLVPIAALSAFTRIEVFARADDDGLPLDAEGFPFVSRFFRMAVLGDSVAWGNGLPDTEKFPARVARTIQEDTDGYVLRQTFAHTGARVVPEDDDVICPLSCSGEVPTFTTSVTAQVDLIHDADSVDLVLVSGCINDVRVGDLFFTGLSDEQITDRTQRFCGDEMAALLRKIAAAAPRARVVVAGYYPVVSEQSDPFGIGLWLEAHDMPGEEDLTAITRRLAHSSLVFRDESDAQIAGAVDRVNAELGMARIRFAPVDFGPENAVFAPSAWLWGLTERNLVAEAVGFSLKVFPEDPLAPLRFSECDREGVAAGLVACIFASMGHPNTQGARAYTGAVESALRALGVLPEGSPAGGP